MITEFVSVSGLWHILVAFLFSIIPDSDDSDPSDIFPGLEPDNVCRDSSITLTIPETFSVKNELFGLANAFSQITTAALPLNQETQNKPFVPILTSTVKKYTAQHPNPVVSLQISSTSEHTEASQTSPLPTIPTQVPEQDPLHGAHRKSLLELHISTEDRVRLFSEADKPIRFSSSVQRQHKMVEPIYVHFCIEMEIAEPFPILCRNLIAFLIWVSESHHFSVKSIDTVIYASLARLNIVRSGCTLDPVCQHSARAFIAALYRDPSQKQPRGGMRPIIPDDLARIVSAMDMRLPLSYSLAALFNVALASGARGSSCGAIRLKDLGPLFDINDRESVLIITLVKIKARPQECIQLAMGGCLCEKSSLNVLYWIDQHLRHTFSVTLKEVAGGKFGAGRDGSELVWPYPTDSMTQFLKLRLRDAQIDPDHFGFHSFRSGFLASCVIQGEKREQSVEDVLTRCAIITGWKPRGDIQFGYIREDVRRSLVTTNLIGTTEISPAAPAVLSDKGKSVSSLHVNSFQYHLMTPLPPRTNRKSYLSCVKALLWDLLRVEGASDDANKHYINNSYLWYLEYVGRSMWREKSSSAEREEQAGKRINFRTIGFHYLDTETQSGRVSMDQLAKRIFDTLKENKKLRKTLPEPSPPKSPPPLPQTRSMVQQKRGMVRSRVEWSEKENKILLEGIEQHLSAPLLAEKLPIRTEADIYFHVRHLNKERQKSSLPLLHLIGRPRAHKQNTSTESSVDSSRSVIVISDSSSSSVTKTAKRRPPPLPRKRPSHPRRYVSSSPRKRSSSSKRGGKRRSNWYAEGE